MLRELIATDIYKLFMVFARLGAVMLLMPAFSSTLINSRVRLLLALAVSFVLLPVLAPSLPPMPPGLIPMVVLLAGEITIGIFLGIFMQTLMSALDLAGSFIGYASGLTNAFTFDWATEEQNTLLTSYLNAAALTLIFITNTHHLMLRAVIDSYSLFIPGQALPVGDFSESLVRIAGRAFLVGMELAAPMVVFSLLFNTALGLVARMVPQIQVFFVAAPLQIMLGLSIIMVAFPAFMLWFLRHFNEGLGAFLTR